MSSNTNTKNNGHDAMAGLLIMGVMGILAFPGILIAFLPLIVMAFIMLVIIAFVTAGSDGVQRNPPQKTSKPISRATYTEGNQLIAYHDGREVWTGRREVEL